MWVSILISVTFVIAVFFFRPCHINGLVQERRTSSALTMELCLSCSNPLICNNTNCNHFAAIPSYGTILMVVLQKGPLSSMSGNIAIYHDSSGLNSLVSTLMRRGLMLYINAIQDPWHREASGLLYWGRLTHWGQVTHICVVELGHHWFR